MSDHTELQCSAFKAFEKVKGVNSELNGEVKGILAPHLASLHKQVREEADSFHSIKKSETLIASLYSFISNFSVSELDG